MFIYAFVLFFLLTPKVLVSLPAKGSKIMVAAVHALIFALIFVLTNQWVWKNTHSLFEGATGLMGPAAKAAKAAGAPAAGAAKPAAGAAAKPAGGAAGAKPMM
jgi:type IV secretory pathway VirB6-like protein